MIELGKIQKLQASRRSDFGVYLASKDNEEEDILLPRTQVPADLEMGDEVEVFVYRDSEDRLIATIHMPKVTLGKVAALEVVQTTKIGAFLDWGLQKDLFLPFRQQVGDVKKGDICLVGVYKDKTDRLCATMKVYDMLRSNAPYMKNQKVKGIIYDIKEHMGALVAVDGEYHGLIPNNEIYGQYKIGDQVEARVKNIKQDGKLELSSRKQAFQQIEDDATKIMNYLEAHNGKLPLNDDSAPTEIKKLLGISKNAFKRAAGRLMKEGAIKITDTGIERTW